MVYFQVHIPEHPWLLWKGGGWALCLDGGLPLTWCNQCITTCLYSVFGSGCPCTYFGWPWCILLEHYFSSGSTRLGRPTSLGSLADLALYRRLFFPNPRSLNVGHWCETWNIRKAGRANIDMLEFWCWRRRLCFPGMDIIMVKPLGNYGCHIGLEPARYRDINTAKTVVGNLQNWPTKAGGRSTKGPAVAGTICRDCNGVFAIRTVICIVTCTSLLKQTHITAVWVSRLVLGHAIAAIPAAIPDVAIIKAYGAVERLHARPSSLTVCLDYLFYLISWQTKFSIPMFAMFCCLSKMTRIIVIWRLPHKRWRHVTDNG